MSRKGENIYKRKDGRWEGRYVRCYDENERPKYGYVYAKTYTEAKNKLIERKGAVNESGAVFDTGSCLYTDVLDAWLQSSRINIKESTYARYIQLVESHIRPSLGKYRLSKISTQLVEGFIERKLSDGRLDNKGALSPKTVTDILVILKSTMEYARHSNLSVMCDLSKLSVKLHDKEMRVLSPKEQESLVKVLLDETDQYKFGVLLSLYTGIRIGELCALQWEDIDTELSILKVHKTMQRIQETSKGSPTKTKVIITEPKSKCSIRDIPLPPFLIEYAMRFKSNAKAYVLSGTPDKYVEPRTMQNRFKKYVAAAGIDAANYHSLRHTFATRCVEIGFEIKTLSEILGHANVNITLNKYVHSSLQLKRDNMAKLSLNY